jgi:hypothetical protein
METIKIKDKEFISLKQITKDKTYGEYQAIRRKLEFLSEMIEGQKIKIFKENYYSKELCKNYEKLSKIKIIEEII